MLTMSHELSFNSQSSPRRDNCISCSTNKEVRTNGLNNTLKTVESLSSRPGISSPQHREVHRCRLLAAPLGHAAQQTAASPPSLRRGDRCSGKMNHVSADMAAVSRTSWNPSLSIPHPGPFLCSIPDMCGSSKNMFTNYLIQLSSKSRT